MEQRHGAPTGELDRRSMSLVGGSVRTFPSGGASATPATAVCEVCTVREEFLPPRWRTRTCRACGAACPRRNGARYVNHAA